MKKPFTELIGACFTLVLLLIGTTGAQAQYCTSSSNNSTYEWTEGVSFAGIDNVSGASNYSDFSGTLGIVAPGASYEFTATMGQDGFGWTAFYTVFIDFNNNGIYDDPSERFEIGSGASECANGCVISNEILVPADATPGEVGMRVILNESFVIGSPCGTYSYGETEDYSLLIGGDCAPPLFTYNIIDDCEAFTYEVEATLNDFSDNTFITIFIERSDDVEVDPVTIPSILLGQTISLVEEVPFGVTLTASIEGFNPVCNQTRTWSEHGLCPPQNNECETALEVLCDVPVSGSNLNASPYPDGLDICTANASPGGAVWYEFTPPYNAIVSASVSVTYDAQHAVYSGVCGELVCLGSSDFNPIQFNANANETYYVMVFAWGTATGDFDLTMTCTELTCDFPELTAIAVDSEGAEITDEDCVLIDGSYSIQVNLEGGAGNETFTVNVGGTILTMAAGESNTVDGFSPAAPVSVTAVGDDEALCDASVSVSPAICPPENDDCATAQALECGVTVPGTIIGATPYPVELDVCTAFASETGAVWYEWTAPYNAFASLAVVPQATPFFDDQFIVFSGECGDLTCLGSSTFGAINFSAEAGETYYAMVFGWGTSQGSFDITMNCDQIFCDFPDVVATPVDAEGVEIDGCLLFGETYDILVTLDNGSGNDSYAVTAGGNTVTMLPGDSQLFESLTAGANVAVNAVGNLDTDCNVSQTVLVPICPAENDLCADAVEAVCGQIYGGTTVGATSDPTQVYCGTPAPTNTNGGVWYTFSLDGTTDIDADLTGSDYDTKLWLYSGSCDELACLFGDDDGGDGLDSRITATLDAGTYYLYVSGIGTARGNYIMSFSCVDITCSPDVTATAVDSEGTELTECVDIEGEYYVSVAVSGGANNDNYNITINGDDFGQVPADGSVVVGPILAINTANVSVNGESQITCSGTASTSATLCPPDNDLPCDATAIECGASFSGSTLSATTTGAPVAFCGTTNTYAGGVWYSFMGGGNQVTVSLCGSNYNSNVNVYSGTCDALECVGGNDYNFTECGEGNSAQYGPFTALEGVEYFIYVNGGFSDNIGTFALNLICEEFDCPDFLGNIGDACDDGDPDTHTDVIVDGCGCVGDSTPVDCLNTSSFGSITLNGQAGVQTISTCSYETEYSTVSNVVGGSTYEFATSNGSYITVRSGTFDGPILAEGYSPLSVTPTDDQNLYPHWTTDDGCNTATGCMVTTVQCTTCTADCDIDGVQYYYGDPCDDGDGTTYNDIVGDDCNCLGTPYDCIDLLANIGDACDDGDATTFGDSINADCECEGLSAINPIDCAAPLNSTYCYGPNEDIYWIYEAEEGSTLNLNFAFGNIEGNTWDNITIYDGDNVGAPVLFTTVGGGSNQDLSGVDVNSTGNTLYMSLTTDGSVSCTNSTTYEGGWDWTVSCNGVAATSINGTVDWDANCGDRDLTVDFYEPGTAVLVASYTGLVNAAGEFTLPDVEIGTFDVITKVDGFIATGMQDVEVVTGPNSIDVGSIIAGDINGDNGVNIQDVSFMIAAFGSTTGDANFNVLADVNCDGGVNIQDVSTVIAGFNQQGAQAPLL